MVILSDSVTGMFFHFFLPKNHFLGELELGPFKRTFKALYNHIKHDFLTFSIKKISKLEQQKCDSVTA